MKRTLTTFGIVAVAFGILVPAWAVTREGGEEASPTDVPENLERGKELFVTNCGSCHTLYKAGTDGVVGPDLDETLAPPSPTAPEPSTIEPRVMNAIENGVAGRMPAGILSGAQAEEVARFVSEVAGRR